MTEPTDAELDELRQANSGKLNFVTLSEFRTIARAVLAKWGSQPLRHDQSPTLFTVFAKCDEYEGEVPLAQYSATSEYGVLDRVMGDARNAGYTGHAKDRMTELGWRIVPVYAKPKPVAREPLTDSQAQAGAVPLTCEWAHNEDDGFWDTECGQSWRFDDGGPKENHMNFCHCCGKPLRIKGGQHG